MSKETKVGLLFIAALVIFIVGYQYLKGVNVFQPTNYFYAKFDDVQMLNPSASVYLNGVPVGVVQEVNLDPNDMGKVIVAMNVNEGLKIPKSTIAVIGSTGLMGGVAIELIVKETCNGDCAGTGDFLQGRTKGLLEGMFGSNAKDGGGGFDPAAMVKNNLGGVIDTFATHISDPGAEHAIAQSFQRLQGILANLENTAGRLNNLMNKSGNKLNGSLDNMESITANFASSNAKISSMLNNMEGFSNNLKDTDIKGTMDEAKSMLSTTNKSVEGLQTTLNKANATFTNLNDLVGKINNGDGTMGQLMNDKDLYNNLTRVSQNLDLLLQDFRLNPKRYVNVSVFGKKQKKYKLPENDPANNLNN